MTALVVLGCGPDDPAGVLPANTDPVSDRALLFQLAGRLNPYDSVLHNEQALLAAGRFRLLLGGEEQVFDEDPLIYRYVYPEEAGALAGKQVAVLRALQLDYTSTAATQRIALAQVVLPLEALAVPELTAPLRLPAAELGLIVSVRDVTVVNRADHVSLTKDCYRAVLDPDDGASTLEVQHGSPAPAVGDSLQVSGNLALRTGAALQGLLAGKGLELHQGRYCACRRDQQPIPCATFETEANKSGEELSCPVPADLLQPGKGSHALLTFKGPINGAQSASLPGLASATAKVGNTTYSLDYSSSARRYTFQSGAWAGKDVVEIVSIGDPKSPAPGRATYNVLLTRVRVDLLSKMKAKGLSQPPPDEQLGFVAYLLRGEEVKQGDDSLTRLCPVAVTPADAGTLHLCHAANKSFAPGEQLELAARLALDDDPQVIAAWLGSGCFCSKNQQTTSCSDFPEP